MIHFGLQRKNVNTILHQVYGVPNLTYTYYTMYTILINHSYFSTTMYPNVCNVCIHLYSVYICIIYIILFIHSTSLLQDKFFITKHLTDVKRVRWYPGSPEDNHLVVLTNNKNCLRLFKVDKGTGKLVSIWRLGPQTSRILASLGDTAVDFDFAPPVLLGSRIQSDPSIMWPILVLQGNGKITRYNIRIGFPREFFFINALKPNMYLYENKIK